MNKNFKQKLISFTMSLLMLLSSMLGYIPTTTVQAATWKKLEPIKLGADIRDVDPDFNPAEDTLISFKCNKSAGLKVENMTNRMPPWITNDTKVPDAIFQDLSKSGSKLPAITYLKVAEDKSKGYWYDLKVEVTGWEKSKYNWADPNGNKVPPFFAASKVKIGFYMLGCEYVTCKFTWMVHQSDGSSRAMTSAEIADFHGYANLCDLDATQGFKIESTPGLKHVYYQEGTKNISQRSDGLILSKTEEEIGHSINDKSPEGWVTAYIAGGNSMTVSFYDERIHSEKKEDGKTYERPLINGKYPTAFHYGFNLNTLFSIPGVRSDIQKKVGDKGTSYDTAEYANSSEVAYEIDDYNEYDYILKAGVQDNNPLTEWKVTDTLENCIAIDDASKVIVRNKDGKNVTGQFDISVNGQTVTVNAKRDYLESDDFINTEGQAFTISMTVHRKKSEDVRTFMKEWLDDDGFTFYVPNYAVLETTDKRGESTHIESNESWVTDTINAELEITKDAKYDGNGDGWKVGDLIDYTVTVTETRQDAYAVNLVIEDTDLPDYLILQKGWSLDVPDYAKGAQISSYPDNENAWIATVPRLMYGDSVKIHFQCLAIEDSNGKDTINTASVTADNFIDEGGDRKYATDSAEVYVNSPVLTVDKIADRYEYEVGDTVKYTVNVNNTVDYTIAKNVVVSDIELPDGLELQGEPEVDMGEAQTSINWPVPDGTTSIAKQPKENHVEVIPETAPFGNGWTVKADWLPSGQPLQIVFNCVATKNANGVESQNIVEAVAENFLSLDQNQEPLTAKDDAEVYVNTAYFDIEKTTPDYEWQVGDHVPFDITVKNVNDENTLDLADDPKYAGLSEEELAKIGAKGKTVARNVVITDKDIPEGFILDFDSVSATAEPSGTGDPDLDAQIDAIYDATMNAASENVAEEPYDTSDVSPTEAQILAEAGISMDDIDNLGNLDGLNGSDGLDDYTADTYSADLYGYDGYDLGLDGLDGGADIVPPGEGLDETETPDVHVPTPADPMTVEGIPDNYDNHIAGTADRTNSVDEEIWNETVNVPITKTLEQIGNGWQLKISDLPAGYDVKIHFTCEATQPGNGQEGVNIGTVEATNAPTKSDDSEAYINTAVLTIDKEVVNKYAAGGEMDAQDGREGYEFRVGEDVEYKVTVHNLQKGSIARNVVISDISLPEGLMLNEGGVEITGIPDTYVNPIAGTLDTPNQLDPDHYNETEINPVIYNLNTGAVNEDTNSHGWELTIDNLPCTENDDLNHWSEPVVITFHCTATDDVNGWEIMNTAKASAYNAAPVQDTERIWINSPVLNIYKRADKPKYLVGDTITYTIDVTQDQVGCVARNVFINDIIDTEGVKLDKSSIVLIDSLGNVIDPLKADINGNQFTVYTGRHLIKEAPYYNWDAENGGLTTMGGYNPIGVDKESSMRIEYQAEVIDTDLAGLTVHNKATVNSDEDIPQETDVDVPISGPALDIVKESNKTQYQIGEEAQYKLIVRSIYEDTTVHNVVINDAFQEEGMTISKINVRLNGEKIEGAEIIQNADNSFTINTGVDIGVEDKIEVFYTVVFTDPQLHGHDIVNVATAKGDNTPEEKQDNSVRVVDETPGLEIKKSSDKEYYKVGETGHYTVKVTNTEKGTTARNVIIKDQIETDGAVIVPDTIVIRNDKGRVMDDAEIQHSDTRYAIYTGHDLEYKEEFTVTYDVLFKEETLAGKDILNIARATCDNLRVETQTPDPIKLPNGLVVYKYSDPVTGSIVKNGDTINYSVSVANTSAEDIKNVLVKDRIPDYMEYVSSEEQEGVICDTMVLDDELYATFIIENLPAGEERTVTFSATVTDAPQEEMIVNVAQVRNTKFDLQDIDEDTWKHESFRNTNEAVHYTDTRWVKDQNIVYIEPGKLSIDKVSDKTNYSVGETGHYTVTVSQKVKGAVSRNVVVSDVIQKSGAYIQSDSIKAYILRDGAEEEEELTDIQVVAKDYNYTVYTNTNLKYGEKIMVRYDVLFKDAALEGQQIKNIAMTKDDSTPEGDEPTDDNRVTVGDAGLIIAKSSDKMVYKVGDVGKYVLKVTCSDPSRTIENVVVKDVVKQQGAHLVTGTVRTYFDNEELKVNVDERDNGFIVETNHNLSGTHVIWVKYDVVFESESLNGKDVENIATTWGDNTTPTDDDNRVHVGEGDPGKPGDPGQPDTPHNPTPTPTTPSDPVKGMTITKVANKHEVAVGDRVSYTLTAKVNSGSETAKNVVISDTLDPSYFEYLEIDKDSFRSYIDNAEFHGENLNITANGFTLETGKDLAPNQVLKVTYDVLMKDDTLKGKTVKNTAVVRADNMDPAQDKEAVAVINDKDPESGLDIAKEANQEQAKVGDTVKYTLTVRATSKEAAKNVVVKDSLEQDGVELDKTSIRTYLDNAEFKPAKINSETTGFTIETGKDLAQNQVIKVTYNVKFTSASLAGKNVRNTAVASSDNFDPVKDNHTVPVLGDDPIKSGLDIAKEANQKQAKVGDTVKYTLTVKATSKEAAKNVVVKDSLEQDGVELDKTSIRTYLDNAEFKPAKISSETTGFTIETGKDLAQNQVIKVTYNVKFTSASLAGKNVRNTAVASSDNFDPVKDNHIVPVLGDDPIKSGLDIVKSVDHSKVNLGETVKYTLVARTTSSEAAKNVVIKDTLDNNKVILVKDSIKAYLNDAAFTPEKLSVSDNGFTMQTGKNLEAKQVMKVTYEVRMADSSLYGKTVGNVAVLSSDNLDTVDDDAEVVVNTPAEDPNGTPMLTVDKTSNVSQADIGGTVNYVLTVKQTVKGQVAKNVVIRDTFNTAGMKVGGIQVALDGKNVSANVSKETNGFVIKTGTDLPYGSTLKVSYSAVLSDSSLAGKIIGNTASASADNADEVSANTNVSVPAPDPSVTPAPTQTPGQSGDNTTNSIGPKTGLTNHAGLYAGIGVGIVAIALIAVYVMRRKKNKSSK